MTRFHYLNDDEGFKREVLEGKRAEYRVALDLLLTGHSVRMAPGSVIDSAAGRAGELADEPDIILAGRLAVEVKSRTLDFTGPADYPFATAFCGRSSRWDKRTGDVFAIVLMSSSGGIAVVPGSTRDQWIREPCLDKKTNRPEISYACPKALLVSWQAFLELVAAHLGEPPA